MVCNNWDACLLFPSNGVVQVFCCCCWWALIEGKTLTESLIVTVSAEVIGFVPMVTFAVAANTSGTAGNTVDNNLGYAPADSMGVVAGVVVLKSFDCHCGVEPE